MSATASTIHPLHASQQQLLRLLDGQGGDVDRLLGHIQRTWEGLGLFSRDYKAAYGERARDERNRYGDMLGGADLERLALLDELPDPGFKGSRPRLTKAGIIPAMGCPQTCRHCMFIWRPLKPVNPDPQLVYRPVDALADNVPEPDDGDNGDGEAPVPATSLLMLPALWAMHRSRRA